MLTPGLSDATSAARRVTDQELAFATSSAAANWAEWRADFEFTGSDRAAIPVLVDPARWGHFLAQYKVLQQVPAEARDVGKNLCNILSGPDAQMFRDMLLDDTGAAIERAAQWTATLHPGLRVRRSLMAKLAAFARPERFVAWDTYARDGAAALLHGRNTYRTYTDFLRDVDSLWRGDLGSQVSEFLSHVKIPQIPVGEIKFQRRVLDNCLMIRGKRWPHTFPSRK